MKRPINCFLNNFENQRGGGASSGGCWLVPGWLEFLGKITENGLTCAKQNDIRNKSSLPLS